MNTRTITVVIEVTVPATTGEAEVERAINAVLDEPHVIGVIGSWVQPSSRA